LEVGQRMARVFGIEDENVSRIWKTQEACKDGFVLRSAIIVGLGSSTRSNVSGRTALKMGDFARTAAIVLRS
jgi:hypothetical protein